MNHKITSYGMALVMVLVGVWYIFRPIPIVVPPKPSEQTKSLKLTSNAFANEEKIPITFTCDGTKMHPPLSISGAPTGTKSFAIIVDDPDAPMGTFTHWLLWNIDPATTEIPAGVIPARAQEGTGSAGRIGYVPPCPTTGSHRYFFTLYALDVTIGLDGKAKKADLETQMHGHIMEQTNLIGAYERISR